MSGALGALTAFVLSAAGCEALAVLLNRRRAYVQVKPELPVQDPLKARTPSFGGVAIAIAVTTAAALWADCSEPAVWVPLASMWAFGAVGFADDVLKLGSNNGDGLSTKGKLALQTAAALLTAALVAATRPSALQGGALRALVHMAAAAFFLVYTTNGYNITDGVDGLAATSLLPVLAVLGVLGQASALHTLVLILAGALCGFLLLNRAPARIFMGDTGSHAIAALVGASALIVRGELLVLVAGILFTIELLSSLAQIVSIRVFKRKLFMIAPLHHLLEMRGCAASRIVGLFSLVNLAGALCALALLRRSL